MFQSWGWMSCWLESVLDKKSVTFVVAFDSGHPVAAAFFCQGRRYRKRLPMNTALFINSTGVEAIDGPHGMEYNGLLGATLSPDILKGMLDTVEPLWKELVCIGMDAKKFSPAFSRHDICDVDVEVEVDYELPSYFADLDKVRDSGQPYISFLSKNCRSQIRRSYRGFEEYHGKVKLHTAASASEALHLLDQLMVLHRARFKREGRTSGFDSDFSLRFHRRLIKHQFSKGAIQLLKVEAGNQVLGYLYNYVFCGRVHFIQGGLIESKDNKLRPGLVCHVEAIEFSLASNLTRYDFLAGDERYKASLATGKEDFNLVSWVRLQRPRWYFSLERRGLMATKSLLGSLKRWSEALQA